MLTLKLCRLRAKTLKAKEAVAAVRRNDEETGGWKQHIVTLISGFTVHV